MRRRDFLFGGAAAGAVLASGVVVPLSFILSGDDDIASGIDGVKVAFHPRTKIGSLSDLSADEALYFDYPLNGQSNILVDLGQRAIGGVGDDRSVVAFSNICTHMGCPITDYQAEHKVLGPCSCHFTTFDLATDGQVVLGQATQNLPRVLLETDGDDIYATGVFRLVAGYADNLGGTSVELAAASSAAPQATSRDSQTDGATDD